MASPLSAALALACVLSAPPAPQHVGVVAPHKPMLPAPEPSIGPAGMKLARSRTVTRAGTLPEVRVWGDKPWAWAPDRPSADAQTTVVNVAADRLAPFSKLADALAAIQRKRIYRVNLLVAAADGQIGALPLVLTGLLADPKALVAFREDEARRAAELGLHHGATSISALKDVPPFIRMFAASDEMKLDLPTLRGKKRPRAFSGVETKYASTAFGSLARDLRGLKEFHPHERVVALSVAPKMRVADVVALLDSLRATERGEVLFPDIVIAPSY